VITAKIVRIVLIVNIAKNALGVRIALGVLGSIEKTTIFSMSNLPKKNMKNACRNSICKI
jgi:hypothetical protein